MWRRVSREVLYAAKTCDEISVVRDRVQRDNGTEFDYISVDCPYQVVFCVVEDGRDQIGLILQHRYLFDEEVWEIPAGSPDPGESLEQGIRREVAEETGATVGDLTYLGEFYTGVGITNQRCHFYCARVVSMGAQDLGEDERIRVVWMTRDRVRKMLADGKIKNAGAALGLLLTFLRSDKSA